MSVLINYVIFCQESERAEHMERIRAQAGIPPGSLNECPYVLIGDEERMRAQLAESRERFGLQALILSSAIAAESAERFVDQVLARP